ncbi:PQQ-binding-like beta-propeller repeat protein [Lacibacterium aquatile]|uniref:PQQ-binding-like beta-propeller repeat protein n=1 Tax=Lacibacterium aquatile TaxID=1168082 RepID=A0ABW5DRH2_9PROT
MTVIRTARIHRTAVLMLAASMLVGCSTFDDWFGEPPKPPLPGERIAVLQAGRAIAADPSLAEMQVELPPPAEYPDYPQAGGWPDHAGQHLELGDSLKEVWRSSIGSGSAKRRFLSGAPVVADGKVFTIDVFGNVTATELQNGRQAWRVDVTPSDEDDGTISGAVAYDSGRLYAATSFGQVVALDGASGKEIWRQAQPAPMRGAPTIVGNRVFVVTIDNQLVALSAEDGRRLWSHAGINEAAGLLGAASPAVDSGIVVSPYSSGELFALRADTGRIAWGDNLASARRSDSVSALANIRGNPVIDRGLVIAGSNSGRVAAIDMRNGERLWDREIPLGDSPWVAGDYVFALTPTGELYSLRRESGRVRWSLSLDRYEDPEKQRDPIRWAGPVLAGDRLILVGSHGYAVAVSPYTGQILGQQNLPGGSGVTPVVAAKTLLVLTDDGTLVAYR